MIFIAVLAYAHLSSKKKKYQMKDEMKDMWKIDPIEVNIGRRIANGSFGVVYEGWLYQYSLIFLFIYFILSFKKKSCHSMILHCLVISFHPPHP